jgi:uncharacterized protein YcfL
MKTNSKIVLILSSFLFVACYSNTAIPMGEDSYVIQRDDDYLGTGISKSNKTDVYDEAESICRKKGLKLKVLSRTISPSVQKRVGSTNLHFKCIKSNENSI